MDITGNEQTPTNKYTSVIWCIASFFIILSVLIQKQGKLAYFRGVFFRASCAFCAAIFLLPFILLSRKHPTSLWVLKYGGKAMAMVTGNHTEIRVNGKSKQKGQGIVVLNHQSFIDIMSVAQLFEYYGECIIIVKKELKNVVPIGTLLDRPGCIFVDRKDKNAASSLANQATSFFNKYKDGKIMICPEGTRNDSGTFLPFKIGAFRLAIDNQVPIFPCVISPYYFIERNKYFNKGKIIIVLLDPIDTTGMTEKDTDYLIQKTRNIMLEEYKKLGEELKISYER